MIYECTQCGTDLSAGRIVCPKCGKKFDVPVPDDAERPERELSRVAAATHARRSIIIFGSLFCCLAAVLTWALVAAHRSAVSASMPHRVIPQLTQPKRAATPSRPLGLASTPEYELASYQKPGIPPTDPLVHEFAVQLDRMEAKRDPSRDNPFSDREGLVRITLECHNLMAEKGMQEECLTLLTRVNDSVPEGTKSDKGAIDLFAAYAASRTRR